jgi:hypothetical protein
MRHATDVAGVCREIVLKTAMRIQGRQFVKVEGWQAIATAHGCCLSVESVDEDEFGNVTSWAAVRRISDGTILAKAQGFVGMDERTWGKRDRYARRAMAQTRAMSRVARSAFAHVVVLIDANLSTTPAEEVPDGGFDDKPEPPAKREFQMQPDKQFTPKPAAPKATDNDRIAWLLRQVQSWPEAATEVFRQFKLIGGAEPYTAINPATVAGWARDKWQSLVAEVKERATQADDQLPGAEAPPVQVPRDPRDPRTEQTDPDWWRSVKIHFGKSEGLTLEELDKKALYGWCLNWEPQPYEGAVSPEDARLRRALDDAATHYKFANHQNKATA